MGIGDEGDMSGKVKGRVRVKGTDGVSDI